MAKHTIFRTSALRDFAIATWRFTDGAIGLTAKLVACNPQWESKVPVHVAEIDEIMRTFKEMAYARRVYHQQVTGDISETGDNVLTDVLAKARSVLWDKASHGSKAKDNKRTAEEEKIVAQVNASWFYNARAAGKPTAKRERKATAGETQPNAATHSDGTPKGATDINAPLEIPSVVNSAEQVLSFALNIADAIERFERTATQAKIPTGDIGMYMRDFVKHVRSTKNVPSDEKTAPPIVTVAPRKRRAVKSK